MELGGNIKLTGFDDMEPAKLVVIKKIVGNYVKELGSVKELNLNLLQQDNDVFKIKGSLALDNNTKDAEIEDNNLFFALNSILNKLRE